MSFSTTRDGAPGAIERGLEQARRLFEKFHRYPPERLMVRKCRRRIPKVLVRLGRLRALVYSSDRGRPGCERTFIHIMKTPPTLASDVQGRKLFVIGGSYRVTPYGIVG